MWQKPKQPKELPKQSVKRNLYLMKSAAKSQRWRKLLGEMRADGTLEQIYARYVSAGEARKFLAF